MRYGADQRTQCCLKCRRADLLERDMLEAKRVIRGRKRGWLCPACAEWMRPRNVTISDSTNEQKLERDHHAT